jgi:hypothetical protein
MAHSYHHNGKCAQRIYNKRDNDKDLQHLMYGLSQVLVGTDSSSLES